MTSCISIKTVTTDDEIITIEKLAKEIWNQHFALIVGQAQVDYMLNKFQTMAVIKESIEDGYIYYIAYHDDTPCGYSAIKLDNGVFLSKFYVKQSQRGKGIGRLMLNIIKTYAGNQGANRIWLTCNRNNKNTLAVYERLGFIIIKEVEKDIGNGFIMSDFMMEKKLD